MDKETGETVISGMGELHLDVYVQRMSREYNASVEVSPPRVAYRETISQVAEFNYTHKKQTGGSGQYGRVQGHLEPSESGDYEFVDSIRGGSIPREFITSCDKGFRSMLAKGRLVGAPVVGLRVEIRDGASHSVDSSDVAFQEAARGAFRDAYSRAKPVVLEPLMRVVLEGPAEFHGPMVTTLVQRRGMILGSTEDSAFTQVEGEVPLAEMFGYATALRSTTQGKAEFTMEFARYQKAPKSISDELIEEYEKERSGR
jgi:elongation factor G